MTSSASCARRSSIWRPDAGELPIRATFVPHPVAMLLRAVALYFTLSGLSMQAQSWNWATALFGTGQPRVEAVAALADGGAFVCGEFNDTLRTDADTIVTNGSW